MKNQKINRPDTILSDSDSYGVFNDVSVRKGTIKAFLENIVIFEDPKTDQKLREEVLAYLKESAPFIKALGLDQHVIFKNKTVQKIIDNCRSAQK